MATIDQLTPEQLRDPEVYEKIKELANSYIFHVQAKEAYFLQQKLESRLKSTELYKKYQSLIVHLKWTALLILPNEEVLKVLRESYLAALENEDIDVLNRIEAKMFILDIVPRDELRREMQKALKENKERLGNKTFGEWLLDYSRTFDFRDRDELTPAKYISQNPEAQILSALEKNKLRKAFQIFDKTLLVTPVMSEPAFSMMVRAMIKAGTIKERVNPVLLQPPIKLAAATAPKKKFKKLFTKKPKPEKPKLEKPKPPEPVKPEPKPPAPKISPYEKKISPYERKYEIRTMKQDIERAKKQPIPEKPKPKIKNNIVDLSGK